MRLTDNHKVISSLIAIKVLFIALIVIGVIHFFQVQKAIDDQIESINKSLVLLEQYHKDIVKVNKDIYIEQFVEDVNAQVIELEALKSKKKDLM